MPEIMRIAPEKAKLEPESQFRGPEELMLSQGLTAGEKKAALERWSALVNHRMQSVSEGMAAPAEDASNDAELLRRIELALDEVERVADHS